MLLEVGTSWRDKQDFFAMQQSYYCSLDRKRRKGSFKDNLTFRDSTKRVLLSFSILLRRGSDNSDFQIGVRGRLRI